MIWPKYKNIEKLTKKCKNVRKFFGIKILYFGKQTSWEFADIFTRGPRGVGHFSDIFSSKKSGIFKNFLTFFWRITRKGAVETVYQIMNILQDKIIVFTILFIVPVLRLMSDRDQPTRQLAAQTFGKLIQLMPLGGISNAFWLAIT